MNRNMIVFLAQDAKYQQGQTGDLRGDVFLRDGQAEILPPVD
jgi:hypothetical protein